jgi:hypothetical protein
MSSGTEHIAICQKPAPKPVKPSPAVRCVAERAVAVIVDPTLHMALPRIRPIRRPKRSLFVPARINPIEFAAV